MADFAVRFVERIRPARRAWVWSFAAMLFFPALIAGVAIAGPFGLLGAAALTLFPAYLLAERLALTRTNPATVALEDGALVLPHERIATTKIRGGFDVPGSGVVVDLVDGTSVKLGVIDDDGEKVLAELGVGASQRTLRMPLRGQLGAFTLGFLGFVTSAFLFGLGLRWLAHVFGPAAFLLTALVLPSLVAAAVVRRFGSPHVVVGLDGVRIRGMGRVRFVPRADIARVRADIRPEGLSDLVIERRGGAPVILPIIGVSRERVDGLIRRLDRMSREPDGPARVESMLARGGRPLGEWKAALAKLAAREAGFREMPVEAEDLYRVLGDGQAASELRIGAALALRVADPEAAPRIRVAASTTAEDELRAALASIAEDEVSDAALERVTRFRT